MAKKKSWKQIVKEADPDHGKDHEQPVYIFGNGVRTFKGKKNPYSD
jgi:hypothetical protein